MAGVGISCYGASREGKISSIGREGAMRIKLLIITAGLLLSGCSATLTSKNIVLDLQSPNRVPIGVTIDRINTSQAGNTGTYNNSANDLYNTLLSESKGIVGEYKDQPLLLSIAYQFKPEFDANPLIGVPSLFLPFLAFVPEDNDEEYRVDYAVTDSRGNAVHRRSLKGRVAGSITGYFIGRLDAAQKLRTQEGEYAANNAARLVLKDIDQNMETLIAAVNSPHFANTAVATPAALTRPSTANANAGVGSPSAETAAAYEQVKKANSYAAYEDFLKRFPDAPERKEALAALAGIVGTPKPTLAGYKKFVNEFPDGLEFVPQDTQLFLIGPEGMRVHDILGLLKEGIEDTVIAAKIRMQNGIYRDFSFKEISALKKKGVPACIVEAMLDSTNRAKRAQEEQQKKQEMEALLADIQHAQKRLDELKTAQAQQVPASAYAQQ
jgi:hypothetical protein